MKNIALFLLLIFIIACNSEKKENSNSKSDSNIVSDFLEDVSSLEKIDNENPIILFQELANEDATKIINISKDNIEDLLKQAKEFKHCVITTGNHTIIKIIDLNDCKQSGSWAACMPVAEGYIKKGSLLYQEGYMNNIIGLPDSQDRKAFLFN